MQGATEVWPVSSSAHLALLPRLLGWDPPGDRTALSAALHAGSAAGLAWGLRRELRVLSARDVAVLAASTAPAALAGLVLHEAVEARLGGPRTTAALLAAAGLALAAADARSPAPSRWDRRDGGRPDDRPGEAARGARAPLTVREAALGGLAQAAALAPGVSRSGAVLTALRAAGVPRERALRTSLLLSLPVTAGAAALPLARLARRDPAALRALAPVLAAGVPVAAVSAVTVLRAAPPRRLGGAALYRLVLAAAVAASSGRGSV